MNTTEPASRKRTGERIRDDQQIRLLAQLPIADVLDERQIRHLARRGKLLAENHEDEGRSLPHIYALDPEGNLTYRFSVSTFVPQWHLHVLIHPTSAHLAKYLNSRSKRTLLGVMMVRNRSRHAGGLLAEINLVAAGLTETTIIHEAIHAGSHLALILPEPEVRKHTAPISLNRDIRALREEVLCWTVDVAVKHTVMTLAAINVPCASLRTGEL